MDWLRRPDRCSCPLFSGSAVLDTVGGGEERRDVWLSLIKQQTSMRWAKKQVDALRAELTGKSTRDGFERQAFEDELTLVQADLRQREMEKQCRRMDDGQLRTRSAETRALLQKVEELVLRRVNDAWWGKTLADLALRRAELIGDLRWIEAQKQTCGSTEKHVHANRQSRQQKRINDWEKEADMAEIRIEMELTDNISDERAKVKHIRCVECRVYKDPKDFRAREGGHGGIARTQRCLECEFPYCEACERQRSASEGPVLVREKGAQANGCQEEGPWYKKSTPKARPFQTSPDLGPDSDPSPDQHKPKYN